MTKTLPSRPDLDWLKKSAKERLAELRAADPSAKLHQAQLDIAREYGFASWRALKEQVDSVEPRRRDHRRDGRRRRAANWRACSPSIPRKITHHRRPVEHAAAAPRRRGRPSRLRRAAAGARASTSTSATGSTTPRRCIGPRRAGISTSSSVCSRPVPTSTARATRTRSASSAGRPASSRCAGEVAEHLLRAAPSRPSFRRSPSAAPIWCAKLIADDPHGRGAAHEPIRAPAHAAAFCGAQEPGRRSSTLLLRARRRPDGEGRSRQHAAQRSDGEDRSAHRRGADRRRRRSRRSAATIASSRRSRSST